MEVLDLRTYRDLQYVRNTESLMKGLDSRLKVATEGQKNLNVKSFQVTLCMCPPHLQVEGEMFVQDQCKSVFCKHCFLNIIYPYVQFAVTACISMLNFFEMQNIGQNSRKYIFWYLLHPGS